MPEQVLKFWRSDSVREAGIPFEAPRVGDAGFGVRCLDEVVIEAGQKKTLETGLHLAIPEGWVGLVRDRSSIASRGGVLSAGVIDASYRGELKVLMWNLGKEPLVFSQGDKIAQCLVLPHLKQATEVSSLAELGETERGSGGFGSTGR